MIALILLICCSPAQLGVVYNDQTLDAMDMHLHSGTWSNIQETSQDFLASRFPFPLGLTPESFVEDTLTASNVVQELDKGGLSKAILFAVYAPRSVGVATNSYIISQIEQSDRLYGLASLSVDEWELNKSSHLENLESALSHPKMIGVKLAHTHQHFRMDDPRYYPIYEIAGQYDAPVYIHTGPSPFSGTNSNRPYIDPLYLEEAIVQYPQTDFILGHMCYDFIDRDSDDMSNCYNLAKNYDNVWLEPSAFGSDASDPTGALLTQVYQDIKEQGLIERMVYGSDGPQSPGFTAKYLKRNVEAMMNAGYTAEEAQRVLYGTAQELFDLEASP